ncbi:MAG: F0F1 ATP synthase subunit A [Candidatus Latescibacterota bacterium]|nr:F0F1 ATP synthase subunit A [Candidatus Latescibacterota bacterium]
MATGSEAVTEGAAKKDYIMEHLLDSPELHLPPPWHHLHLPNFELFGIDVSITRHVVMMWVAALILIVTFTVTTRRRGLVPSGLSNALEAIVQYVREEIAVPNIGKNEAARFMPFLLTVFFFILTCNLLGLVPYGSTATGNVSVTAGLALCAFITIQLGGILQNGLFGYFKGLVPHGLPLPITLLMIPIEVIGLLAKPFALCIRLFANMTAGHVIILALLGLIFLFESLVVAPVSVAFALAIYLLEIFVALVQAYIFTMLSAVFIGMAVHQDH